MHTIKSKIGIRRIGILFVLAFCMLFGYWLCSIVVLHFPKDVAVAYMVLFMGLSFIGLGICGFVWDYKNVHAVEIDEEQIKVSKRGTYYWKDLDSITLHTTKNVSGSKYGRQKSYKAILINFKNEPAIYLFDIMYLNTKAIRAFLQKHVIANKR